MQGDVYKIVDSNGQVVASYTYDAWGKVIAVTDAAGAGQPNIADINPIRYRGYYYDTETGLYYLNSGAQFKQKQEKIISVIRSGTGILITQLSHGSKSIRTHRRLSLWSS
jgi:YD repeat-containing protein